jgi:hypothetical protein
MSDEIRVRVFDIVGGPLCVSADDGQAVHDKIAPLLRDGHKVTISFEKVKTMISAFLNAAVGQLYGEFSEDQIRDLVSVRDMEPEDLVLLKRVVENAKAYFRDPERYRTAVQPISDDDHEE